MTEFKEGDSVVVLGNSWVSNQTYMGTIDKVSATRIYVKGDKRVNVTPFIKPKSATTIPSHKSHMSIELLFHSEEEVEIYQSQQEKARFDFAADIIIKAISNPDELSKYERQEVIKLANTLGGK